jgi:hypothetical protein
LRVGGGKGHAFCLQRASERIDIGRVEIKQGTTDRLTGGMLQSNHESKPCQLKKQHSARFEQQRQAKYIAIKAACSIEVSHGQANLRQRAAGKGRGVVSHGRLH